MLDRWLDAHRAWFDIGTAIAAILTIPLLVIEQHHQSEPLHTIASIGDWLTWGAFAVEAVLMTAFSSARLRWLREHPLDIAVVVLTIPLAPPVIQSIRAIRILRLLRLVALAPIVRNFFSLEGLRYVGVIALITLVAGAEAFSAAEKISIGNSIYWAITTMTTVGYGDITPKTTTGKAVASVMMLVGVGVFAMVTGALAQRFLAADVEEVEQDLDELEEEEAAMLREVHEIGNRLKVLEAGVRRRAHRPAQH